MHHLLSCPMTAGGNKQKTISKAVFIAENVLYYFFVVVHKISLLVFMVTCNYNMLKKTKILEPAINGILSGPLS